MNLKIGVLLAAIMVLSAVSVFALVNAEDTTEIDETEVISENAVSDEAIQPSCNRNCDSGSRCERMQELKSSGRTCQQIREQMRASGNCGCRRATSCS